FVSPPGSDRFAGDTDLKFDGQGRLFWSNLAGSGGNRGLSMSQINPTTGANITSTRISNTTDDKAFLAIDTNPDSPFLNTIYVVWDRYRTLDMSDMPEVVLSRSTNQAVTWSTPLQLSKASVEGYVWPSDVSVAPNGDVYVAYHSQPGLAGTDVNPPGT